MPDSHGSSPTRRLVQFRLLPLSPPPQMWNLGPILRIRLGHNLRAKKNQSHQKVLSMIFSVIETHF
jgi:hypothetical protein